jgi:hypothetical protein
MPWICSPPWPISLLASFPDRNSFFGSLGVLDLSLRDLLAGGGDPDLE